MVLYGMVKPIRRLLRPLRRGANRCMAWVVRTLTGLLPITETHREDIFLVAYPKSGITWLQHLVAGIIYGLDPAYAPDALVQELVPDVERKRFYKRFRTPMFFKSHHLPQPEYQRVVYLLRDGRDAMVSYWHFRRALEGEGVDFLEMVQKGVGLIPCKWHEHVEAWLANPFGAQMLLLRYEELLENPLGALQRFCEFVGEPRDQGFLQKVAQGASFARMREKEIRYGWDNPRWPRDRFFVRRGQVGSYKDEMPPEVLQAFLQEAGETLRKLGYPLEEAAADPPPSLTKASALPGEGIFPKVPPPRRRG